MTPRASSKSAPTPVLRRGCNDSAPPPVESPIESRAAANDGGGAVAAHCDARGAESSTQSCGRGGVTRRHTAPREGHTTSDGIIEHTMTSDHNEGAGADATLHDIARRNIASHRTVLHVTRTTSHAIVRWITHRDITGRRHTMPSRSTCTASAAASASSLRPTSDGRDGPAVAAPGGAPSPVAAPASPTSDRRRDRVTQDGSEREREGGGGGGGGGP